MIRGCSVRFSLSRNACGGASSSLRVLNFSTSKVVVVRSSGTASFLVFVHQSCENNNDGRSNNEIRSILIA
ncbi:MAG TPA: hypothetical protein DCX54_03185 [Flavobacteriales bacterium]|nr:hypothetical protein [Flavobacteriales bacterium]